MTEAEPVPVFRRFPWVQFMFCLACLSMTVWTWMRYSYCWDVSEWIKRQHSHQHPDWPSGAYVELRGVVAHLTSTHMGEFRDGEAVRIPTVMLKPVAAPRDFPVHSWEQVFVDSLPPFRVGETVTMIGRVCITAGSPFLIMGDTGYYQLIVDARRSRFTSQTVAGLVVGAMGCFIFGLYLRRWLIDRGALASEPGRDMIA